MSRPWVIGPNCHISVPNDLNECPRRLLAWRHHLAGPPPPLLLNWESIGVAKLIKLACDLFLTSSYVSCSCTDRGIHYCYLVEDICPSCLTQCHIEKTRLHSSPIQSQKKSSPSQVMRRLHHLRKDFVLLPSMPAFLSRSGAYQAKAERRSRAPRSDINFTTPGDPDLQAARNNPNHRILAKGLILNSLVYHCVRAMSSSAESSVAGAPRRRNGRQQACEPCRLRKVACDHRLPTCSRCKRGGISEKCVYVPQRRSNPKPSSITQYGSPRRGCPSPSASPVPRPRARPECNVGYLGPTSFEAVFEETRVNLPSMQVPTPLPEEDTSVDVDPSRTPDQTSLDIAISILQTIPEKEQSIRLFGSDTSVCDGWCRLATVRILTSLWTSFGPYLEGERDKASLDRMSKKLFSNNTVFWQENHSDPDEWLHCFSGPNMRWEALGLIFAYWAMGVISPPNTASKEDRQLNKDERRKLMLKYKNSASRCAELCRCDSNGNTVLLYLLYKNTVLESLVSGDASTFSPIAHSLW